MLEDNVEVLKASKPLSEKSLERFEHVRQVVNTPYSIADIEKLIKRYDALVEKTKAVKLKGPDHTENWSDRITQKIKKKGKKTRR